MGYMVVADKVAHSTIQRQRNLGTQARLLSGGREAFFVVLCVVLARSARPAEATPAEVPEMRLFARGFFHPATLLHTARHAAAATYAVRHVSYADVVHLSGIYEEQERYRRQIEQVGLITSSQTFDQGLRGMIRNHANLSTILAEFWYRECHHLHRYGEILFQFDGSGAPPPGAVPERCGAVWPK